MSQKQDFSNKTDSCDSWLADLYAGKPGKKNASKEVSVTPEKELNGVKGLEPTRYGDWEKSGRCIDF